MFPKSSKNSKITYYSNCDNLNKFNITSVMDIFDISKITISCLISNSKSAHLKEYFILYNFFVRLPFIKTINFKKDSNNFYLIVSLNNKFEILSFLKFLFIENNFEPVWGHCKNGENLFFELPVASFTDLKYLQNYFDSEILFGSLRINISFNKSSLAFIKFNFSKNLPLFWISG